VDDLAKKRGLGRKILVAFDLAADPVALELSEDFVAAGAGDVHLVERLHGRQPRGAAAVGLAAILRCRRARHQRGPRRRWSRTSANAARAASPPLSASSARARDHAWASVSTVSMPLPIGRRRATDRSMRARAD